MREHWARGSGWMRYRTALIVGVVWGLAWLLLPGSSPGSHLQGLSTSAVSSATLQLITVDNLVLPLKLLLLPGVLGLDLAIWTVGLLLWPFSGQPWPGTALGAALSNHSSLASLLVIAFSGLAGAALALGIAWLAGRFRRLPSRS